jgi:type VI secretion system secreted protein Hcp
MSYEFYVTIDGAAQNKFKGESLVGPQAEKMTGLSFKHEITAPRDIATGLPSGKRQHRPISFVKEWGPASPQIMQAVCTNEMLKTVLFEFFHTTREGKVEKYYTIELTNATICGVKYMTGAEAGGSASTAKTDAQWDTLELEEVSFTYQKIAVSHLPGSTSTSDDWVNPNS